MKYVWLVWSNYIEELDSVWTSEESADARAIELNTEDDSYEWLVSKLPLDGPGQFRSP